MSARRVDVSQASNAREYDRPFEESKEPMSSASPAHGTPTRVPKLNFAALKSQMRASEPRDDIPATQSPVSVSAPVPAVAASSSNNVTFAPLPLPLVKQGAHLTLDTDIDELVALQQSLISPDTTRTSPVAAGRALDDWEEELSAELALKTALPSHCLMVDDKYELREEFKNTHQNLQFVYAIQMKTFDPDFDDSNEALSRCPHSRRKEFATEARRKRNFALVFNALRDVLGGKPDPLTGEAPFGDGAQYLGYMIRGKYDPGHSYIQVAASLRQMEELAEHVKMQMPGLMNNFHPFDTTLKASRERFAHPQNRACPALVDAYFKYRRSRAGQFPHDEPDPAVLAKSVVPDKRILDPAERYLDHIKRQDEFRDQFLRDRIEQKIKEGIAQKLLDLRSDQNMLEKGPQWESDTERRHKGQGFGSVAAGEDGHATSRNANNKDSARGGVAGVAAAASKWKKTRSTIFMGTDAARAPEGLVVPDCECNLFVPYQAEELVRMMIERALDNVLLTLDQEKSTGNGLRELKRRKVIKDIFPLHYEVNPRFYRQSRVNFVKQFCSIRNCWVSAFSFLKKSEVFVSWMRDYFGEKVAMYFAFLHFYNNFTLYLAVLGLVPALWGYISTADNISVVVYCVVIMIWAALFVKFWNRESNDYAFDWDMLEYEQNEGEMDSFLLRLSGPEGAGNATYGFYELEGRWVDMSDFANKAKQQKDEAILKFVPKSHVDTSGRCAPCFFNWYGTQTRHGALERAELNANIWRYFKESLGWSVITTLIGCVLTASISLVLLKLVLVNVLELYGQIIAGVANGVVIFILDAVYKRLAMKITEWENHRTVTQYEEKLTSKCFVFQFVNSYFSLFYIAFVKTGLKNKSVFGYTDYCKNGDGDEDSNCMTELSSALMTLLLTRLALSLATQRFLPKYITKLTLYRLKLRARVLRDLRTGLDFTADLGGMFRPNSTRNKPQAVVSEDEVAEMPKSPLERDLEAGPRRPFELIDLSADAPHIGGDIAPRSVPTFPRPAAFATPEEYAASNLPPMEGRESPFSNSDKPYEEEKESVPEDQRYHHEPAVFTFAPSSSPPPPPPSPPQISPPPDGASHIRSPTGSPPAVGSATDSTALTVAHPSLSRPTSSNVFDAFGDGLVEFGGDFLDVFDKFNLLGEFDKMSLEYQAIQPKYAINRNVLGTFDDYNELVIGYGYMVLFAAAFPIAPSILLAHNVIQNSTHGFKLIKNLQKPKYYGATDIGMFWYILVFLTAMSVLSNTAIICFTSTQLERYMDDVTTTSRLVVAIALEHIFGLVVYLVLSNVSDFRPALRVQLAFNEQVKDVENDYAEYMELKRARQAEAERVVADKRKMQIVANAAAVLQRLRGIKIGASGGSGATPAKDGDAVEKQPLLAKLFKSKQQPTGDRPGLLPPLTPAAVSASSSAPAPALATQDMDEHERKLFEEFKRQRAQSRPEPAVVAPPEPAVVSPPPSVKPNQVAPTPSPSSSPRPRAPPAPAAAAAEDDDFDINWDGSTLPNTSFKLRRVPMFDPETRELKHVYTQQASNMDVFFPFVVRDLTELDGIVVSDPITIGMQVFRLVVGKRFESERVELTLRYESGPLPHFCSAYLVAKRFDSDTIGLYRSLTHMFEAHTGFGFPHFASLSELRSFGCYKPKRDSLTVGLVIPSTTWLDGPLSPRSPPTDTPREERRRPERTSSMQPAFPAILSAEQPRPASFDPNAGTSYRHTPEREREREREHLLSPMPHDQARTPNLPPVQPRHGKNSLPPLSSALRTPLVTPSRDAGSDAFPYAAASSSTAPGRVTPMVPRNTFADMRPPPRHPTSRSPMRPRTDEREWRERERDFSHQHDRHNDGGGALDPYYPPPPGWAHY